MARFTFHNMLRYLPRSLCLPMLALTGCVHAHSQSNAADAETLGLTVDKNGTILLAGKPYYAFGVNSFSLVIRYIEGAEKSLYRSQFELLKKYGIPYIRVNFGGYWPEYYEKFDADPDEILSRMRDVVQCAEEYKIGLICSLLWYDASIPAHVGERRSDMGSSSSKTVKYAVKYVSRIVSEFKDSPAVWAWEIGNEYNLGADLCDPDFHSRLPEGPCTPEAPSGYDFYTSEELIRFYTAIGAAIRKQDPVRMLSSGNGDLRCASKSLRCAAARMNAETHLWKEEWTPDTLEDFYEMCAYFTPDPIDTISFHLRMQSRTKPAGPPFCFCSTGSAADNPPSNICKRMQLRQERQAKLCILAKWAICCGWRAMKTPPPYLKMSRTGLRMPEFSLPRPGSSAKTA